MQISYENHLDTDKFARMFNNKAQSYKFYWFEAILNLSVASEEDLAFEEIIDEMICEAWHTVTHYHPQARTEFTIKPGLFEVRVFDLYKGFLFIGWISSDKRTATLIT